MIFEIKDIEKIIQVDFLISGLIENTTEKTKETQKSVFCQK